MGDGTIPAVGALVVGAVGLTACWMAMSHALPRSVHGWWRRWWRAPGARIEEAKRRPVRRRVVTGTPVSQRMIGDVRPTRHLPLRPDVLRRERERLGLAESRRVVEHALAEDPKRLADAIERLLADDRHDATTQRGAM